MVCHIQCLKHARWELSRNGRVIEDLRNTGGLGCVLEDYDIAEQ